MFRLLLLFVFLLFTQVMLAQIEIYSETHHYLAWNDETQELEPVYQHAEMDIHITINLEEKSVSITSPKVDTHYEIISTSIDTNNGQQLHKYILEDPNGDPAMVIRPLSDETVSLLLEREGKLEQYTFLVENAKDVNE